MSSRSPVVAPSPSSLSRRVSATSVSCPSLLVRRLGRGLGRPSRLSGRFGPVGHPSGSVVYLRQGTASCSAGAFPVPVTSLRSHSGCLLRTTPQLCIPFARGVPLVSSPHHLGSGDLALDGVHLHPPASPVPSGLRHRPNRLPVSPSPAHTSRVVFTHDRLSVFEKTVAGSNVFFATSAPHRGSIYFSPFRVSVVSRHGRVSPDLGQPSGFRVPSGGCHLRIIAKLQASTGTGLTLVTLHWAKRP